MLWRKWLAEKIAPKAEQLEKAADDAIPDCVKGVRMPRVRYLVALALLVICVVGYSRGWHKRFVKPDPSLVPVATQGGGSVYQGNQVPAMARTAKAGKSKPTTTVRPVTTTPVDELPPEEQAKAPVIPPTAGPDNVVRKLQLGDTQIIPPGRGETYARAYLLPDGTVKIFQDPQQEKFRGWKWKHFELEGGYGVGGKQVDVQATWLPIRLGNVHVGARAETWTEIDGTIKGAGSIRVRWEPFRESYR
ncbi:MAG: hypothetical protein M1377_01800 [Deltaproteobacteria bacterium]|nr:hypothetical protein [Deltaproteobacteria bacterium]